jgi:hypothetical protein
LTGDVGRGCGDASRALLFHYPFDSNRKSRPARIDPPIFGLPPVVVGLVHLSPQQRSLLAIDAEPVIGPA